uniref:Uncharacterized protein n=2 Tax=Solanum lycopersicum TaxID=4081 RepID=A0A3Q7GEA0_SOLLC
MTEITQMKKIQRVYNESMKLLDENLGDLRFYKYCSSFDKTDYIYSIMGDCHGINRQTLKNNLDGSTSTEQDVRDDISLALGEVFWETFKREVNEFDVVHAFNRQKTTYYFFTKEEEKLVICLELNQQASKKVAKILKDELP